MYTTCLKKHVVVEVENDDNSIDIIRDFTVLAVLSPEVEERQYTWGSLYIAC